MGAKDTVVETLRDVVAPLVEKDGGEVWLVSVDGDDVRLHLAGTCAGCPGATLTTRGVIEPALKAANGQLRLTVTAGIVVPDGATRVSPAA